MLLWQKGSWQRKKNTSQELHRMLSLRKLWTFLDSETEPSSHIFTHTPHQLLSLQIKRLSIFTSTFILPQKQAKLLELYPLWDMWPTSWVHCSASLWVCYHVGGIGLLIASGSGFPKLAKKSKLTWINLETISTNKFVLTPHWSLPDNNKLVAFDPSSKDFTDHWPQQHHFNLLILWWF